jgi:hypothetical protein
MSNTFFDRQIEKAVLRFCEDLSSPMSLKVSLLIRHGEWDQLASCKIDPRQYIDAESYWRDATATSLLRKMVELPTTFDRKAKAEEAFLSNEATCLRTNRRLYPYLFPHFEVEPGVRDFLGRARKVIAEILGRLPDDVEGRFGPGATYGDRGRFTTIPDKMSANPTLTPDAKYHILPWHQTLWAKAFNESGRELAWVQGNRFTTVPKDCEKDRGIAVEPSINAFFQLGYGRVIRHRLKRAGLNLQVGQDIHRRVACEASIRGHLATIDLSNASDTVSRNLVKLLLPTKWYEVLDDLRSKKTEFRGKWHVLEKFSSMGNGFTFELETLIFLGLILALSTDGHKLEVGRNVFVFGDDIIVPSEISQDVISMLEFFGMSVNKGKTFVDGPFRESCGGDFFLGVDVRPFFLKEYPNEPQQLISFANGLRRLNKGAEGRSSITRRAWFSVLDALPSRLRHLRGPEDLGDLLVHDEEECWQFRWRSGIRYFNVYRPARYRKVSWRNFKPGVTLAAAIYGVPWNNGDIIPRDAVAGYKIGWVPRS